MNTWKLQLAGLVLAMGLSGVAQAATTYSVIALHTNDLGNTNALGGSTAYGINNSGQVVGSATYYYDIGNGSPPITIYSSFFYNGVSTSYSNATFADGQPVATGINDSGVITGTAGSGGGHAYSSVAGDIGTLGGPFSYGNAINSSGQIVGYSYTSDFYNSANSSYAPHAFLYSAGSMTDLGTLGGVTSIANAINDSGQIVGGSNILGDTSLYAFLYSGGSMTNLGIVGEAYDINNSGQIVGGTIGGAFVYSAGITTILGSGGFSAFGINDSGQIVGGVWGGGAFLYSDGVMTDLNSLIDPSSGWVITDAQDINNSGQIAANGHNTITGYSGALLLSTTPVPEPETYAMLLAGLGMVGFAARRRTLVN